MKAKFFFLFILSGFAWLDWSCGNCPGDDVVLEVVGIEKIELKKVIYSNRYQPLIKDTIDFDSLFFDVRFIQKRISAVKTFTLINQAFATPPCHGPALIWKLDSIKVFSIVKGVENDVTKYFSLGSMDLNNSDSTLIEYYSRNSQRISEHVVFGLNAYPKVTESAQYKFQFFDKQGRIFTGISESVVITP